MASIDLSLLILILKNVCLGSLLGGLIIFFLTLFLQGSHLFQHGTDLDHDVDHGVSLDKDFSVDHDVSVDHDISMDHDFSLDHDISVDHDLSIDSDVDIDVDHDISVGIDKDVHIDKQFDLHDHGADTPTPLMLLLGTFMITFGASGTFLIDMVAQGPPPYSLILLAFIIGFPFASTYVVTKIWGKMAVSEAYETALETIKIDDAVKTLTTVDTKGGLVVIETQSVHGPVKMAAKTKYGAIARNMTAYVIEIQGNTLIIDEWSSTDTDKPIPEGSIKWE
ncbi:MAG: NfeD family protein [Promethearchaeota archaeon]